MKHRIRWENKNVDDMGTLRNLIQIFDKHPKPFQKGVPPEGNAYLPEQIETQESIYNMYMFFIL